jgi:hypothetical protein
MVTDRFSDLLGMDWPPARPANREIIETFACLVVVLSRPVKMRAVALLRDEWSQHFERRADVTYYPEIDRRSSPYLSGRISTCAMRTRAPRG